MQDVIKYGLLAISIGLIEIGIYYHLYGSCNPTIIMACMLLGFLFSYLIKKYYDKSDDDESSDLWITLQTIVNTDVPTEEYYARRFNLLTGEVLTKGQPKSEWIVATHLKEDELNALTELVKKIKPFALTDENIVKTECKECLSDKYSLMITLQKNKKMSVLKSIINRTIFSTNDDNCEQLVGLIEKIDHLMPYWNTAYEWN